MNFQTNFVSPVESSQSSTHGAPDASVSTTLSKRNLMLREPTKIPFEALFLLFRHEWVWDFFFKPAENISSQLKWAISEADKAIISPVEHIFSMDDGPETTSGASIFKGNENVNLLALPSFSTGELSLAYVIIESNEQFSQCFTRDICMGRSVRDDANGIFTYIDEDPKSGTVELSVTHLISPSKREFYNFYFHYDVFRAFVSTLRGSHKPIDTYLLHQALILTLHSIEYRTCPQCLSSASHCTCQIRMHRKAHPMDLSADSLNLKLFLGDYDGSCVMALYDDESNVMKPRFVSKYVNKTVTRVCSDETAKERLSKWALRQAQIELSLVPAIQPQMQVSDIFCRMTRGRRVSPLDGYLLGILLQHANTRDYYATVGGNFNIGTLSSGNCENVALITSVNNSNNMGCTNGALNLSTTPDDENRNVKNRNEHNNLLRLSSGSVRTPMEISGSSNHPPDADLNEISLSLALGANIDSNLLELGDSPLKSMPTSNNNSFNNIDQFLSLSPSRDIDRLNSTETETSPLKPSSKPIQQTPLATISNANASSTDNYETCKTNTTSAENSIFGVPTTTQPTLPLPGSSTNPVLIQSTAPVRLAPSGGTLPKIAPAPIAILPTANAQRNNVPTVSIVDERKRKAELRKAKNREAAHRSNHRKKMELLLLKEEIEKVSNLETTLRAREKVLREENVSLRRQLQRAAK